MLPLSNYLVLQELVTKIVPWHPKLDGLEFPCFDSLEVN